MGLYPALAFLKPFFSLRIVYAAISIVTTGQQTGRDKLLEIAIAQFDPEGGMGEVFSSSVNPNLHIPQAVQQLTGLHPSELDRSPQFYVFARKVIELTEGRALLCHNARFVYSFIKKEFKDLGFTFQRDTICLEKTTRELLPDCHSTSLPYLARSLSVSYAETRRAKPQAEAMARIMQALLVRKEKHQQPPSFLIQTLAKESLLPEGITKTKLGSLPNAPGVYFFHDHAGEVIYVGKSISIKKRVRSHFQIDLESPKAVEFKNSINDITFRETGSELVALLHESELIKDMDPVFNYAQKRRHYGFCLDSYKDEKGYLNLKIERMSKAATPHLPVSSIMAGKGLLYALVDRFNLCQKYCGLYKTKQGCFDFVLKKCQGACIGKEAPELYNQRVVEALGRFRYPQPNFFIVETGRNPDEAGVVLVEDNQYIGFGYIDREYANSQDDLRGCITYKEDNKDVQRIIRSYMASAPKSRILAF